MALKAKVGDGFAIVNNTIKTLDTNGDNYLGRVPKGYRGAVIMFTVNSGSCTAFTVSKATNLTKDESVPTVISYESGAVTKTGGDTAVMCGEGVDLYGVITGVSSLDGDVEVDMFK